MFSKLLKNDLRKNMRWLWILFASTILSAGIVRGCAALGEKFAFFKILAIFFDSVFYAVAVNVILQPFLRSFLNFTKSFYSDESYLTHTLPVTKNALINSKFLTAMIEITLGFLCLVVSLLIKFASPTMLDTLKLLLSVLISGEFSVLFVLVLIVLLIVVEFLMYIAIIFFSIVVAYRSREKRVLKAFLLTAAMAIASIAVLAVILIIVLVANGVKISSSTLVLSSNAFISILITGIAVYCSVIVLFYFLAKREFNKGVNVD